MTKKFFAFRITTQLCSDLQPKFTGENILQHTEQYNPYNMFICTYKICTTNATFKNIAFILNCIHY